MQSLNPVRHLVLPSVSLDSTQFLELFNDDKHPSFAIVTDHTQANKYNTKESVAALDGM